MVGSGCCGGVRLPGHVATRALPRGGGAKPAPAFQEVAPIGTALHFLVGIHTWSGNGGAVGGPAWQIATPGSRDIDLDVAEF